MNMLSTLGTLMLGVVWWVFPDPSPAPLTPSATASYEKVLTVDVHPLEALTVQQGEAWTGFEMELFGGHVFSELKALGYTSFEVNVVGDASKKLDGVKAGEAHISIGGISITHDREAEVDFAGPILNTGKLILARLGGEGIPETAVGSWEDLKGIKVGTKGNTNNVDLLEAIGADIVSYGSPEEAVAALSEGEVEVVVYDSPFIWYYETQVARGNVVIIGDLFAEEHYGWAVQQGNHALREALDLALLGLREDWDHSKDSTYNETMVKWFGW